MSVIRYRRCHRYIPKNIQPVRPKCNKLLVPSKKILLCIFSIVEDARLLFITYRVFHKTSRHFIVDHFEKPKTLWR